MEPVVRLTRPSDINTVTTMDLKCYHYPLPMATWQELIQGSGREGRARIVLVEVFRRPAGFAMWNIDDDKLGLLHRVGVLPVFRLKGIGAILVAACIKNLQENNCNTVRVIVPDIHCRPGDQDDVSSFLTRLGFCTTGEIVPEFKTMYGKKVDGYIFERGTHDVTYRR